MGRNLRWSIVPASPPQRRMAVQDDGAKLRLFQASQTVRGEKIKTAALQLTYSRQPNSASSGASPGDRSPDPSNLAESTSVQACRYQPSR